MEECLCKMNRLNQVNRLTAAIGRKPEKGADAVDYIYRNT